MTLAQDRRKTPAKDRIALDRATVRTLDRDGHLHVAASVITSAQVNDYVGAEIVGYKKLGLDPQKIYAMFRPPEELEKAYPSLAGKQLLSEHKPQSAEAPDKELTIGAVMNPAWRDPIIVAELVFWDAKAIEDVENNKKSDLSAGYWYRAEKESGAYRGKPYQLVMRDIEFNHVTICDEGRVDGAFVGDSKPSFLTLEENPMTKTVLSRKAVLAKGALAVYLKPKMATDAKIDFNAVLKGVTAKNFGAQKAAIAEKLKTALSGKLAADADITDIVDLLDALEKTEAGPDDKMNPVVDEEMTDMNGDEEPDMEAVKAWAKEKLSPEDHAKLCEMLGEKAAMDEPVDAGKNPMMPKKPDEEKVTKAAMDQAIAAAVKMANDNAAALRAAENDVRPYIGEVTGKANAADVYRMALDHFKVDHKTVTELPALKVMVSMLPKPGAKQNHTPRQAADAATVDARGKLFPDYHRLAN